MQNLSLCFFEPNQLDNIGRSRDIKQSCLTLAEMETADCNDLGNDEWEVLQNVNLTDRQIQCMWLYYFENQTQQAIADLLGITRPVVCIYLQRARKRISKYFKGVEC